MLLLKQGAFAQLLHSGHWPPMTGRSCSLEAQRDLVARGSTPRRAGRGAARRAGWPCSSISTAIWGTSRSSTGVLYSFADGGGRSERGRMDASKGRASSVAALPRGVADRVDREPSGTGAQADHVPNTPTRPTGPVRSQQTSIPAGVGPLSRTAGAAPEVAPEATRTRCRGRNRSRRRSSARECAIVLRHSRGGPSIKRPHKSPRRDRHHLHGGHGSTPKATVANRLADPATQDWPAGIPSLVVQVHAASTRPPKVHERYPRISSCRPDHVAALADGSRILMLGDHARSSRCDHLLSTNGPVLARMGPGNAPEERRRRRRSRSPAMARLQLPQFTTITRGRRRSREPIAQRRFVLRADGRLSSEKAFESVLSMDYRLRRRAMNPGPMGVWLWNHESVSRRLTSRLSVSSPWLWPASRPSQIRRPGTSTPCCRPVPVSHRCVFPCTGSAT